MPKVKKIPALESEEQEREFWGKHDSSDYMDWKKAERVRLAGLRPTTRMISIRLPETMIERLKVLANKRDVPYQSLLKIYVAERIEEDLREDWPRLNSRLTTHWSGPGHGGAIM